MDSSDETSDESERESSEGEEDTSGEDSDDEVVDSSEEEIANAMEEIFSPSRTKLKILTKEEIKVEEAKQRGKILKIPLGEARKMVIKRARELKGVNLTVLREFIHFKRYKKGGRNN